MKEATTGQVLWFSAADPHLLGRLLEVVRWVTRVEWEAPGSRVTNEREPARVPQRAEVRQLNGDAEVKSWRVQQPDGRPRSSERDLAVPRGDT